MYFGLYRTGPVTGANDGPGPVGTAVARSQYMDNERPGKMQVSCN